MVDLGTVLRLPSPPSLPISPNTADHLLLPSKIAGSQSRPPHINPAPPNPAGDDAPEQVPRGAVQHPRRLVRRLHVLLLLQLVCHPAVRPPHPRQPGRSGRRLPLRPAPPVQPDGRQGRLMQSRTRRPPAWPGTPEGLAQADRGAAWTVALAQRRPRKAAFRFKFGSRRPRDRGVSESLCSPLQFCFRQERRAPARDSTRAEASGPFPTPPGNERSVQASRASLSSMPGLAGAARARRAVEGTREGGLGKLCFLGGKSQKARAGGVRG